MRVAQWVSKASDFVNVYCSLLPVSYNWPQLQQWLLANSDLVFAWPAPSMLQQVSLIHSQELFLNPSDSDPFEDESTPEVPKSSPSPSPWCHQEAWLCSDGHITWGSWFTASNNPNAIIPSPSTISRGRSCLRVCEPFSLLDVSLWPVCGPGAWATGKPRQYSDLLPVLNVLWYGS